MAKVYLEDSELTAIGDAIREKNGETTLYLPSEMPEAISAISGGGGEVPEHGYEILEWSDGIPYKIRVHGDLANYALGFTTGTNGPFRNVRGIEFVDCKKLGDHSMRYLGGPGALQYDMHALDDEAIEEIGDYALMGCRFNGIPSGVKKIGNYAYSFTSALTSAQATSNPDQVLTGPLPNTLTSIGNYAFYHTSDYNYRWQMSGPMPDSITSIGDYAFEYSKVKFTSLPANLTYLGASAFRMCTQTPLHIVIPTALESIGSYTFYYCGEAWLETIPANISLIGSYAFDRLGYLKTEPFPIVFAETSEPCTLQTRAFGGASSTTGGGISEIDFRRPIVMANTNVFNGSYHLKKVTFRNGLTPVNLSTAGTTSSNLFNGCPNVESITMLGNPEDYVLPAYAFYAMRSKIQEINVSWSEGEVANAPWGASASVINYNYVPTNS